MRSAENVSVILKFTGSGVGYYYWAVVIFYSDMAVIVVKNLIVSMIRRLVLFLYPDKKTRKISTL